MSGGRSDDGLRVRLRLLVAVVLGVCLGSWGVGCRAAFAEGEVPWWNVVASVAPTNLPPGGTGRIVVAATNLGDGEADGSSVPITVSDRLPAGIVAIGISSGAGPFGLLRQG